MAKGSSRLLKEYRDILHGAASPDTHHEHDRVVIFPTDVSNMMQWQAYIAGPAATPYHYRFFQLDIRVPHSYPLEAPKIRFVTPIFHPNIHFKAGVLIHSVSVTVDHQSGEICLDILKSEWSPAWTLTAACRAIIAMLSNPEPDSPLNCNAGNLLRDGDEHGYDSLARMYAIDLGLVDVPDPVTGCKGMGI